MAALAIPPFIPAEVRPGYTTGFSLLTCLSAATKTSLAIQLQQACVLHKEEDFDWAFRSGQTSLQQGWAPLRWVIPISRNLLIYSAEQSLASRRWGKQGAWERPAFLSPLSHLSLTKVVKCFPVHLLSHRYLHSASQEDKSGEVCLPRLPPPPPLQQPWEQNTWPCHRQPVCVTPPKWRSEGDTIWWCNFWHYSQRMRAKVRAREETSREVWMYGGRQHGTPLVAQLLPHQLLGKNELLRRYIHKQNLKDSIWESRNFSACMKETTI